MLYLGVPIGFRGRIGNLLSIDEELKHFDSSLTGFRTTWEFTRLFNAWFSVDPVHVLHRGDAGRGLQEKLRQFLRDQNEDPDQWPYAYMLCVPGFLNYARHVVTWWYLYSPSRQLDAVIMEIYNSFGEKRCTLFRVKGKEEIDIDCSEPGETQMEDAQPFDKSIGSNSIVRYLNSSSKSDFYKGSQDKDIFASPFERVGGTISIKVKDPLDGNACDHNTTLSNTTTIDISGQPKMSTRIAFQGDRLDPIQEGCMSTLKFLILWTLPGLFTSFRVVFQALKLHYYKRAIKMMDKPDIREGSISRQASNAERALEPFFQSYLAHCVEKYPGALEVNYERYTIVPKDYTIMRSPVSTTVESRVCKVKVSPLDPGFYSRIVDHADAWEGLQYEMRPTGKEADVSARAVLVSDAPLMKSLVSSEKQNHMAVGYCGGSITWRLFSSIRGPKFIDSFVCYSLDPNLHAAYIRTIYQRWLTKTFAFNSDGLFALYSLAWGMMQSMVIFEMVSRILNISLSVYKDSSYVE